MIAVLLAGCVLGFELDDKALTCAADPYDWGAGLTTHLVNGEKDGTFDYDPDDGQVARVDGSYDLASGDFAWTATFVADSWRTTDEVDGFGSASVNGDLDVAFTLVSETGEGPAQSYDVRDVHLGCDLSRTIEDAAGGVRVYDGVFTGGGLDYVHTYVESDVLLEAVGRSESDGSFVETVDLAEEGIEWTSTETGDTDGVVIREYDRTFPELEVHGSWTRHPDGTLEVESVYNPADTPVETWTYTVDAAGDGDGKLKVAPDATRCDLVFVAWDCTQQGCDEGLVDGPCHPPIAIPDWRVRL